MRTTTPTALQLALPLLGLMTTASAQTEVAVMPGYPNAPFTSPSERFVARDGQPTRLWGNVNEGLSAPAGATYEWYVAPNGNVTVTDDGDLTGTITDPRVLVEDVTFTLTNGSEREILQVTLMVTDPAGGAGQRTLDVLVLGDQDPDVDTPLEELDVDARVAVQRAMWFLYNNQEPAGNWDSGAYSDSSATAFALWAIQNQGHSRRNDPAEDIFAPVIGRGFDKLFETWGTRFDTPDDLTAPRATVALGATADGVSDLNNNGQTIRIGVNNDAGYHHPIALAAVIASNDPDETVRTGVLAGMTYRELVEDGVDWLGANQNQGNDNNWAGSSPVFTDGRGGWNYEPRSTVTRSDMSINGWAYVALEGAIDVFGVDVPDWMKREIEHTLIGHMRGDPALGLPYSYVTSGNSVAGRHATTGAGLTGLTVVLSGSTAGSIISQYPFYPIDSLADQRTSAIKYLGKFWDQAEPGASVNFGSRNRGNFYVMWSVARGLRATATSLGLPAGEKVLLDVNGQLIDWETGASPGMNEVPLDGREGYWSYLRRTQYDDLTDSRYGTWTQVNQVREDTKTAMGILILTRRVFLDPCPALVQIEVEDLSPTPDSSFEAGVPFTFTGRARRETSDRPVTDVFVDGRPVESLDATGRFFTTVMLDEGANVLEVEAFDECGSTVTSVTLTGSTVGGGFDSYGDVTPFLELRYRNTTFNRANGWLVVDVEACSSYDVPLPGPILLALDATSTAAVQAVNPDGVLPDGRPYFIFVADAIDDALAPGACTQPRQLLFDNPGLTPFTFESTWLAPGNGPPAFRTSPPSRAYTVTGYVYDADAVDPEGAPVSYGLLAAPAGMGVDSASGVVTWSPSLADLGTHQVVLEASDGTVGSARQSWTVEVVEGESNRPPYFTSAPVVRASVGASYAYTPTAEDPDRDAVAFTLDAAVPGMTIDGAGTIAWDFALAGAYPVIVRATDPAGAYALQGFTLTVGSVPTNPHAPTLNGTPAATAVAGLPYRYQPIATDADPGDTLDFSLDTAPVGMGVNPATGLVTWTPGTAQAGLLDVVLRVTDSGGNFGAQAWSIDVTQSSADQPPSIVSLPPRIGLVGAAYAYTMEAFDPEGEAVQHELVAGPAGMAVDPVTGLVTWTPSAAGVETVALRVTDPGGNVGSQAFDVLVSGSNTAPNIVSMPGDAAIVGAPFYYDVNALDAEGHAITYSLANAPGGVTIDAVSGVVRWTPIFTDLGTRSFEVVASDIFGAEARQPFDVEVTEDMTPPTVDIVATPAAARLGEPVSLCVLAGDDVAVVERTLSIDGVPAALDLNGCVTRTFDTLGTVQLVATARDSADQISTTMLDLQVVDPNDVDRPEITLVSPAPGALLRGPVEIVASIEDDTPAALSWRLEARPFGSDDPWTELGSGTGAVAAGPLGRFDTTRLANGTYDVRVVADDGVNAPYAVQFPLDVAGGYKLGDFGYSDVDLTVSTAGFPIAIERIYSTLDPEGGDFGPGWSLGVSGGLRDSAPEEGNILERAYTGSTRVYVTLPTGALQVFRFQAIGGLFFTAQATFEAEGTTTGTLRPARIEDTICVASGGLFFTPFDAYNPSEFIYTDPQGNEFLFHEASGLVRITDQSGETIDVTDDGVLSSRGPSILFERNAEGLIERVVGPDDDPAAAPDPMVVEYGYDAQGRLTSVGVQGCPPTTYLYEDAQYPLYLTSIMNADGSPFLRNKFNDEGLLIAQCGPDGDVTTCVGCDTFDLDSAAEFQTITTAAGDRVDLYFSSQGDLVIERRWKDAVEFFEIVRTYDDDGRILSETMPGSGTSSWTYDAEGKQTAFTSASGRSWAYVHGDCGVEAVIAPGGDVTTLHYDDNCRPVGATDPLGNTYTVTYDERGRMATWSNEEGGTMEFLYDTTTGRFAGFLGFEGNGETVVTMANDRFQYRVDRAGRRRNFSFDDQERLVQETWDDGTQIDVSYTDTGFMEVLENDEVRLEFTYWPGGQLKEQRTTYLSDGAVERLVFGEGSLDSPTLGYDLRGNVMSVLDSHGGQTIFDYDALGRASALVWPDSAGAAAAAPGVGGTSTSTGPATGLDGTVTPGGGNGSQRAVQSPPPAARVNFGWDDPVLGDSWMLRNATRISGGAGDPAVLRTDYAYEFEGDPQTLSGIEHVRVPDGAVLHSLGFALDQRGLVESWTDAEGAHAVELDGVGRILSVDHPAGGAPDEAYGYDGNGNRVQSHLDGNLTHSVAGGEGSDRIVSSDNYAYEYDGVGSITRLAELAPGGAVYTFTYDHLRRPRSVVREVSGIVELTVEMDYDPLGRMVEERVNGAVRRYVYDGVNAILVVDDAGEVLERRLVGRSGYDDVWAVARAIPGGYDLRWALTDHVGTVRDWVSADGMTVDHLILDSFGNPVGPVDPSLPSVGFQSRDRIADTPFMHFRARLYDPRQGRFLGEDIRQPWSYAFAENNPIYYGDPTGESAALQYACLTGNGAGMAITIGNVSGATFRLSMEAASLGLSNGQNGGAGGPGSGVSRGREAVQTFLTGITIDVAITKLALDLPCAADVIDVAFEVAAAQGAPSGGGLWSRLGGNWLKKQAGPPMMSAFGL